VSAPDYSGTAVTVSSGDGMWRNVCPVDCGWHGSDWEGREEAEENISREARQHRCLRAAPPAGE
jgi:hypothetical protein